jgi:hypothetical protein
MVINFRAREINKNTLKLARKSMLIKKKTLKLSAMIVHYSLIRFVILITNHKNKLYIH